MNKTIVKHRSTNKLTGTSKIYYSDVCFENAVGAIAGFLVLSIVGIITLLTSLLKDCDKIDKEAKATKVDPKDKEIAELKARIKELEAKK